MQVLEYTHEFHVSIDFNRFRVGNTNLLKAIPDSKFNWAKKVYIIPIQQKQYLLDIKSKETKYNPCEWIYIGVVSPQKFGEIKELPDLDFEVKMANGEMRPYQGKGVARGTALKRYINGDEQGLGKTIQTIVTLFEAYKRGEEVFPCLVIGPSSTKINWQREWKKWVDVDAMILGDETKATWHRFHQMGMNNVFIVNFESLKKFFVLKYPAKKHMKSSNDIVMDPRVEMIKSVIVDESHRCKDQTTQQTMITLQICRKKKWVILLSGTPVVNKPIDLFSQLAIMNRLSHFGGKDGFKHRYCDGGKGASNLKELNYLLNEHCFFRREKKDVAKDLPEKQRQTILCDITTMKEYNLAKNDLIKFLSENGCDDKEVARKMKGEILIKMGILKRISALGKINEVKEFIDDVIGSGEKLILFCTLKAIVLEMKKIYPDAVTVTGNDSMEEKQSHIDKFQNDPNCKLIICNIKAAGVGITLTASSRVAFIEYPWTYADCVQCEDRAHRIGQQNNVMCTYFLGNNTIDDYLYNMIQSKRHTANAITGATDQMEMNFVDGLMDLFR